MTNLTTRKQRWHQLAIGCIATMGLWGCAPVEGTPADGLAATAGYITPGSYEAEGVLWVANTQDRATLDDAVRLDARAARNIVTARDRDGQFETLEALDAVSYVGPTALARMLEFAIANGEVGNCGDGVINGAEACDGGADCTAECTLQAVDLDAIVHGIQEGSYLAVAILATVNTASLETLDDDIGLDARAARAITAQRPIATLTALDDRAYVGAAAFRDLRAWVEANDLVPYCGDGVVQAAIEMCDDGNNLDADGCPAHCGQGEDASAFLRESDLVYEGSEIDSPFVRPDRFYMPFRSVIDYKVSDALQSVFARADGIIANLPADGYVSVPELERLSKPGFLESLLDHEQAALPAAWALFEINSAPIVEHDFRNDLIERDFPFDVVVERPGPLVVPVLDVADACSSVLCDRIQRLPGCDADDDASTIHYADVQCARDDWAQVFTPAEFRTLDDVEARFTSAAEVEETGEFRIEFTTGVEDRVAHVNVASFDGYSYDCTFKAILRYTGERDFGTQFDSECELSWPGSGQILLRSLSGAQTSQRYSEGVHLLEHWRDGERIYNRLIRVEYSHWVYRPENEYDDYASALPFLADGTPLESYAARQPAGSRGLRERRGGMRLIAPPFAELLAEELAVGRHAPFNGMVLDVHGNHQLFAYFDDCEALVRRTSHYTMGAWCADNRHLSIEFIGNAVTLTVRNGGDFAETRLDQGGLRLDRSYVQY